MINSGYNEIVYWKKVLLLLPTGAAGIGSIEKMIRFINSWNYKSDLETIALKALMGYAWLFTSENRLEFEIERKLLNTEWKIIALKKWATRSTYV